MSLWFRKTDSQGVTARYSVSVPLELFLVVFAVLAAILTPRYFGNKAALTNDSILIVGIGFGLFVASKVSVFRTGVFNAWGPGKMTPLFRWLYWSGYGFMLLGSTVLIAVAENG